MADDRQVSSELSRDLTLFQITMMGLGMMIGAGVFVGIGNSMAQAGPGGMILTFALNGLVALCTAMSYAELSSAIPRAGGAYNFARVGLGRAPSFVAGWMEWFASSVAGSLYAVTFAIYIVRFLDVLGVLSHLPVGSAALTKIVAGTVALVFLYVNYRGASETGRIGAFFTLGQTLFLVFIGVAGLWVAIKDPERLQNFSPFLPRGWSALLVTMGFTYVAFEGYEVIAQAGDEVIDPRRNLPKAMLYSVLIVTLTYVVVAFACVIAVKAGSPGVVGEPWRWIAGFKERGFGEAVSRLMPAGNLFLTLAVIFASTSALNATIYSATRASYALGRDNMLPPVFSSVSRRTKTPHVALVFTGCIVLLAALVLPTSDVASSASIMFLFLFFLVNVCAIRIRRSMGDELKYGFLMPLFPVLPIAAMLAQAALAAWLIHMSVVAWIIAPVWILAGAAVYRFYSRSRVKYSKDEILVFEDEKRPSGDKYAIMVAVANPDNALSLVRNTYALCKSKQASVELIHMVPVPDQVPLSDADRYMLAGKEGIVETMLYLGPAFPVSSTVRYCRTVARGLVSAAREKKIDMLILGWHGRHGSRRFLMGSTVDPVLEQAPCRVVIFRGGGGDRVFRRVLVPVAGGPNSAFALEVACILAEENEGTVTAMTVRTGDKGLIFDPSEFVAANAGRLVLPPERVKCRTVDDASPIHGILSEAVSGAEDYDLVVMGCTKKAFWARMARSPIPETVAARCAKPVAMVQSSTAISTWLRRWA